jgi:pilus assembly protein CpaE
VLEHYLVNHESGVKALLAPSRPDQASAVTAELIRDAYSLLRQSNDFVIVDTPPGFTSEVIASIDASTDLIMVGMLDSLSLKNTKLGLETLSLMGYDQSQVRLVLNRAHSRVGISVSDVISVLGREPDVYVPSDREIPRAVNEGEPIVLSRPESEAAAAFRSLAALYAGATYEAPALAAAAPAKPRRRLFGRRR